MTMNVARHQLQVETTAPIEVIDISDRVRAWVRASGVRNGLLTVMSQQ